MTVGNNSEEKATFSEDKAAFGRIYKVSKKDETVCCPKQFTTQRTSTEKLRGGSRNSICSPK